MAAQDLAIKLSISADTAEGKAALQAFAEQMGQIQPEAERASNGIKSAFQQMREDLNTAFTFSAGQIIADGLQSGIQGIKQFTADSIVEFRGYEDAITGVAKTTGIKGEELKGLSDQLRQSAIDLQGLGEDAATQMANIAEIAGQLGIASEKIKSGNFAGATEEIAGFAEVIAKAKIALPEFTGGVEEIATSTAKTIQLYGKSAKDAEAILSTYNELSNTTAANAKQISIFMESFTMAPQLKISIEEAAGIGATLISLGQDANSAATNYQGAISQILAGSERSVDALTTALKGSSAAQHQLEGLLGRSKGATENFYNYFKEALAVDAVAATNALIDAIGAMPDSVTQTQTSLDVFGREGARVMNALIGNTDTLSQHIQTASKGYADATSTQAEFETAINKQGTAFDSLKTKVEDIKIEIGENLVAAISEAAKTDISPAIDQFSNWLKTSKEAETFFKSTLPDAISGVSGALSTVAQKGAEAANKIAQIGTDVGTFIGDLQTGQITLGEVGAALGESLGLSQETTQQLMTAATQAGQSFKTFYKNAKTGATDAVTGFQELYKGISEGEITLADIAAAGNEFFDALTTQFGLDAAYDAFQSGLAKVKDGWASWKADSEGVTAAFFDGVVAQFGLNEAYDAMQGGLGKMKAAWGLDWSEWTAAPKAAFLGLWENTTSAGISAFQGLKSDVGAALAGMGDAIAQPFRDGAAAIENAFTGIGTKIGKEFDAAKQKAKDFLNVFESETVTGFFEKITDKIYGVTEAEEGLTESVNETTDAVDQLWYVGVGGSTYPDLIVGIEATKESERGLTENILETTEAVSELGASASVTFSDLLGNLGGLADGLNNLGFDGLANGIKMAQDFGGAILDVKAGLGDMLDGLGDVGGGLGDLGGLLGIKELGGLGGFLGDISKYTQLPSLLGDIGGQFSSLISSAGSLGGLLGGGGLTGILSGLSGTLSGGLGSAISMVSGAFGGLGSTVAGLGSSILSGLGGAVSSVTGLFGGLGGAVSGVLPMLGPIGLAGGAIALAWKPLSGLFKSIFGEAQSEGNKANEAMRKFLNTNIEGGAEMASAMKTAYSDMKTAGFDYTTFLQQTGTTFDSVFGGISSTWQAGATAGSSAMDIFTLAVGKATGDMKKAPQVALQMMASFQDMGMSAEEAGAKMLEIGRAAGLSEQDLNLLQSALVGVTGESGATSASASGLQTSLEGLSGSVDRVTNELGEARQQSDAAGAGFDGAAASAQGLDAAARGMGDSVDAGAKKLTGAKVSASDVSAEMQAAGSAAGGLKADMEGLQASTGKVASSFSEVERALAKIPAKKEIQFSVKGDAIPSMAAGGEIGLSGLAIVNERGPEIARFPGGSMALMTAPGPVMGAFPVGTEIIPHHRARDILRDYPMIPRMAEGGTIRGTAALTIGSIVVHNHFAEAPSAANLDRLTEQMSRSLAQKIRRML